MTAATANVVVADIVETLLILAHNGLTLAVDDRVWRYDAKISRVGLNDLELHRVHGLTHKEKVALFHGTVGLEEVGLEVDLRQRARARQNAAPSHGRRNPHRRVCP